MLTVSPGATSVQISYSTLTGPLIRDNGRTRPATLDEIEQAYEQGKLDEMMCAAGEWIDTATPAPPATHRCRCWTFRAGAVACVILPVGKAEITEGVAIFNPPLLGIFNKVREAEMLAWRGGPHKERPKVFIDLSEPEMLALTVAKPIPSPMRINERPVKLNPAAWHPPTKPAACSLHCPAARREARRPGFDNHRERRVILTARVVKKLVMKPPAVVKKLVTKPANPANGNEARNTIKPLKSERFAGRQHPVSVA